MSFENYVGKEIVLIDEKIAKGVVVKKDNQRADTFIVRLEDGQTRGINVDDYDFFERDNGCNIIKKIVTIPTEYTNVEHTNVYPILHTNRELPSKDNRVYHTTCLDNFLSMMKYGVLASREWLKKNGVKFTDIAVLTYKRSLWSLHKSIPFHFFPKIHLIIVLLGKIFPIAI